MIKEKQKEISFLYLASFIARCVETLSKLGFAEKYIAQHKKGAHKVYHPEYEW